MSGSQEAMFPEVIGRDFVHQTDLRANLSVISDQLTQVFGGSREKIREQAFAIERWKDRVHQPIDDVHLSHIPQGDEHEDTNEIEQFNEIQEKQNEQGSQQIRSKEF